MGAVLQDLAGENGGCRTLLSAGPTGSCPVLKGLGRKPHSAYQPSKPLHPQTHGCLDFEAAGESGRGPSKQNRVPQTSQMPGIQAESQLTWVQLEPPGSHAPWTRITLMIMGST